MPQTGSSVLTTASVVTLALLAIGGPVLAEEAPPEVKEPDPCAIPKASIDRHLGHKTKYKTKRGDVCFYEDKKMKDGVLLPHASLYGDLATYRDEYLMAKHRGGWKHDPKAGTDGYWDYGGDDTLKTFNGICRPASVAKDDGAYVSVGVQLNANGKSWKISLKQLRHFFRHVCDQS